MTTVVTLSGPQRAAARCARRGPGLRDMFKFLKTFAGRLRAVVVDFPTAPIELLVSLVLLAWSMWLVALPDAFDLAVFRVLRAVMPHEVVWAALFGALGLARVAAMGIWDFSWRRDIRKLVAFWDCMVWLFCTAAFYVSSHASLLVPTTSVFVLASAWAYWRLPCRTYPPGPRS